MTSLAEAPPKGFEPLTPWTGTKCSSPLSYEGMLHRPSTIAGFSGLCQVDEGTAVMTSDPKVL